jgi:hypothetical protein
MCCASLESPAQTAASRRCDSGHEELSVFGGTAKELSGVLFPQIPSTHPLPAKWA